MAEPYLSLLQWAERVQAFRQNVGQGMWVSGPLRQTAGFIGLFILTCITMFIRPRVLHGANAMPATPFLDGRAFALGAIGFYELLGGQFAYFEVLKLLGDGLIGNVAKLGASVLALLLLVGLFSLSFWIGARAVRVPLPFQQSTKLAGYGLGIVLVLQLLMLVYALTVEPLFTPGSTAGQYPTLLLIIGVAIYWLHITIVTPMAMLDPALSRYRLWFGCGIGLLVSSLIMRVAFETTPLLHTRELFLRLPLKSLRRGFT